MIHPVLIVERLGDLVYNFWLLLVLTSMLSRNATMKGTIFARLKTRCCT